ncbi:MAG: class I SAM-dependent methyltransferase [Solirubrobacterales bacterium]
MGEPSSAFFDGLFGRAYDFYIERERLARLIGRVIWNADIRPFYASMQAIADVPKGGSIVDAPCGGGVAFRALRPSQDVGYLAIDLSEGMLARARRLASELGLDQIEFLQGDAEALPVADASTDLFLSYFGLHCFPHPERAVAEIARCLRPGGRVVGGMIVRGRTLRHRLLVRPGRGVFGPTGTSADLERWISEAGLALSRLQVSGLLAYFQAERPMEAPERPI